MQINNDDTATMQLPENTAKVEDDSEKHTRRRHKHRSVSAGNTLNSVRVHFLFTHEIMTTSLMHCFTVPYSSYS